MHRQERIKDLEDEVARRYRTPRSAVRCVFAPYRICPLGAHIDHQLGRVTAMTLDRGALLAYAPSPSREVRLSSLVFAGEVCFSLDDVPESREDDWGNYARGAVRALQQHHPLSRGMLGVTDGGLSEGGLSSSAAIGVAYLLALEDVNGLLDQSAILLSRRNYLTFIDCATVGHELIPRAGSSPDFAILVAFSGVRKALVATDYNRRVGECAEAARTLLDAAGKGNETPLLGNVSAEEYEKYRERLSGAPGRRAAHFFSEVARVARGVEAWKNGDLEQFGRLITASGESSIKNYECGSPPLIDLYHILIETEGVYGARFSGAGFRGCCVALVRPETASQAAASVRRAYARRYPRLAQDAPVLLCHSDDGARIL